MTQTAAATVDVANELFTNGQTSYTQDLNGNRLTETTPAGTLRYSWDGRNRLSSITDPNGDVTAFKYDSGRNLTEIEKIGGGTATVQKFVYDNLTNTISLTDPTSGLPVSVVTGRGLDSHYASVDSVGNVAFGMGDALGSNGGVTNGSGSLTSRAFYEPYGQTTSSLPVDFPFAYTGRVPVTQNIVYFRARFYDSATGLFLSEDPAGFGGGDTNLYAYVGDSPFKRTDPVGLGFCTYYSRTGQMTCISTVPVGSPGGAESFSGTFTSGNNNVAGCENNPACERIHDVGPIPSGWWEWNRDAPTSKRDGYVLDPIHAPNNPNFPYGRGGIQSHSCLNPWGPTASSGSRVCSAGCVTGTVGTTQRLNRFLEKEWDAGQKNKLLVVPW